MSSNPYENYLETQVFAASPVELSIMLYRAALDALRTARDCNTQGDIRARGLAASRASAAVLELVNSLNDEQGGEVAAELRRLYDYVLTEIHEGHRNADSQRFSAAANILKTLLEGWESIASSSAAPMPEHHEPIACSF